MNTPKLIKTLNPTREAGKLLSKGLENVPGPRYTGLENASDRIVPIRFLGQIQKTSEGYLTACGVYKQFHNTY